MRKTLFLLFAAITTLPFASFGKEIKKSKTKRVPISSTVSLFGNFNSAKFDFATKPDLTTTKTSTVNFGVEVTLDFYVLPHNMYLTTGIRLADASCQVQVGTNVPGLDPQQTYNSYDLTYGHYSIPVRVGKTFKFSKKSDAHFNVFAGGSFGISMLESVSTYGSLVPSSPDGEEVSSGSSTPDFKGSKFYSSADLGFRIAPFNRPNFSFGVMASFDLTKSGQFSSTGYFSNDTKKLRSDYVLQSNPQFFNLMLSVDYTIGKSWKQMLRSAPAMCQK
ncbi:outer membrane beta-barrel protein [Taibaiella soli]|uniref:Outer membrane protein beta-barrel domain-containing protein n=1 Tax=Taibaiella soli TaxID=1649169 RepID=A0A2W2AY14_9BACT|nr:outer membrane beta-barrel protein [Taibaiella soli]PZF72924.1 hypothetical protein DN068_10965 [Taibaiella soli]